MALTFDYKVRDRSGRLVEGQLEGDSMALVVGRLREMGYLPISVTPKGKVNLSTEIHIPGLTDRVKLAEVAVATRQLATMIDSGLSVVRALSVLSGQVENKELARVLNEVRLDVERGSSLSAAVSKHPKVFSQLFVTMVQAGEAGGSLDKVLLDLATTMEKQAALMTEHSRCDDLPGRRDVRHVRHLPRTADLHRAGLQEPVRNAACELACADPDHHSHLEHRPELEGDHPRDLDHRRDRRVQAVGSGPRRAGRCGTGSSCVLRSSDR